ncbi:MAG: hypothetical protein KIS77_18220 [Saprospiraceae bacterium]|nr:hypothetical protein [Saprospiraceae bacterium]
MSRISFAVILVAVLLLPACFEPKEGCLDIEATNFDAAADRNCCCQYPRLRLETVQRFDTLQYLPDSLYQNDAGQIFRIKSVVFYLSEFELFQDNGLFAVSDTVQLFTYAPTGGDTLKETFIKDFLLVRRTPVDNPVGEFQPTGVFERVKVRLGLSPDAQRVVPQLAPAGSPLRIQGDSLWYGPSVGYVFLQAVVARDSMLATKPDTLAFTQADLGNFFIENTGNFVHESGGFDFRLKLGVDYKKMFAGINWTSGDIPSWKSQIVANLPNVFSVSQ